MQRIYTILMNRGGRFDRHSSRRRDAALWAVASSCPPPVPVVHTERMSAGELSELALEDNFVAAAEVMRTELLVPSGDATPPAARRDEQCSWGVDSIGAARSKFTGAGINIALLDTGIERAHAAFRDVDIVERDFTGRGVADTDGHGTHNAGIVFGRNVGGMRIGVAPGVRRALAGKIVGPDGGDSSMLARGLVWAFEEGAQIIAVSSGLDFAASVRERVAAGWSAPLATSAVLEAYCANLALIDRLLQMLRLQEPYTGGVLVMAAAGDDSCRDDGREFVLSARAIAASDRVMSVGALDRRSRAGFGISGFSNIGVEISAPGRQIPSAAIGGGLAERSGTATALPHAAGVAALWWQAIRQAGLPATATLVREKLKASADRSLSPLHPDQGVAGCVVAPRDGSSVTSAPMPRRRAGAAVLPAFDVMKRAEFPGIDAIAVGLQRGVVSSNRRRGLP